ncbi:MAG TPA: tetratricopeptide repeat protein [Thermoanaerobaculia bacterium]|nr:tetratricopeptide repeat protein [Thermoanaerobaculia bacterium]
MRQHFVRFIALLALLVLALPNAYATCGGGGGGGTGGMMPPGASQAQPQSYVVPWKVLQPDAGPPTTPLTLYWFPANKNDVKGSDLLTSRALTLASAQCVSMFVVVPEHTEAVKKFGVENERPTAILTAPDGTVIARVVQANAALNLRNVEEMVRNELKTRESALDKMLDDAKAKEKDDKDGAIAMYQQVWDQRCLAPKKGRGAQKALARLGVTVTDAQLRTVDPIDTPEMNRRMTNAMNLAFRAELAEDYAKARKLYAAASKIDPADPVPYRFLGELYRHHTGEWDLARATFEKLLTIQPDPLSRAVALHGLGKMTIHMGDSAKGLALFEQSIQTYPLALTYRNLAVYWNSERVRDKAEGYVQKALALDPDDAYNLIFAATYMVDSGRAQEALKIAKEHENLLSASYNLAAIYALLGQKGKAMELLNRHFYKYERYDDVRAMEMWEARVDYVFASIKDDADFVKLTAMAR